MQVFKDPKDFRLRLVFLLLLRCDFRFQLWNNVCLMLGPFPIIQRCFISNIPLSRLLKAAERKVTVRLE